jgi:hypothetical protein
VNHWDGEEEKNDGLEEEEKEINAVEIAFEKGYAKNIFQSKNCALRSNITHEEVLAHTRFIHS